MEKNSRKKGTVPIYGQSRRMGLSQNKAAFTPIELLVVIAVIGRDGMKKRILGKTVLEVSEIGLGGLFISLFGGEFEQSKATILQSV